MKSIINIFLKHIGKERRKKIKCFLIKYKKAVQSVPILLSICLAILTFVELDKSTKVIIVVISCIISIFYAILIIIFNIWDSNEKTIQENQNEKLRTLMQLLSATREEYNSKLSELNKEIKRKDKYINNLFYINLFFTKSLEDYSKSVNKIAKHIFNGETKLLEDYWDMLGYSKSLCEHCFETMNNIKDMGEFTSVNFISVSREEGKIMLNMLGYAGLKPEKVNVPVDSKECTNHYARIAESDEPRNEYLVNKTSITKTFKELNDEINEKAKEVEKEEFIERCIKDEGYSQYVGIPIFCDERKIVGILQITTKVRGKFGKDKKEVKKFIDQWVMPYTSSYLLIHKIKKGVFAIPPKEEEGAVL